jgi:hypothetical protein
LLLSFLGPLDLNLNEDMQQAKAGTNAYHKPVQRLLPTVRGAVNSGRALRRWRIADETIFP